jgi:hypothetical protein
VCSKPKLNHKKTTHVIRAGEDEWTDCQEFRLEYRPHLAGVGLPVKDQEDKKYEAWFLYSSNQNSTIYITLP